MPGAVALPRELLGYAVGEVTAHGLRTTASTLLNENGKWSADAIERSLAHADKDDPDSIRSVINKSGYALAPARAAERPHPHFLAWHREHRFKQ
jgi:integrase